MAGAAVRETVTLARRAERARAARASVSAILGPGHPCGDVAVLLVTEIFGNSLRHAGSGGAGETVTVSVRSGDGIFRVEVAQVSDHAVYQGSDVLLLRAAARPLGSASVPWPDPADAEELRMWLVKTWENPVLREAVACASPSLALRADRIADGRDVPARQVLSAAVALARYQLRAAGRPTPFGLFAGASPAARCSDSFYRPQIRDRLSAVPIR
jgi:hypothetical protein